MPSETVDLDALTAKLMSAFKAHKPTEDDDDDGGSARIPRERLQREIAARKASDAKLAELAAQVEALANGHKAALAAKDADFIAQAQRMGSMHSEDLQLVDLGFSDPIGRKVLRDVWEGSPKEARGKSPAEFWQTVTADPERAKTVPRALTPYLPTAEAPPKTATKQGLPAGPGKTAGAVVLDGSQGVEALMAQIAKLS